MNKAFWACLAILYSFTTLSGQSYTDVKIVYPKDTIDISLSDREVRKIERKTRQMIDEFACDQIIFDNSKSYSLDSAQEYHDYEFIYAIDKIPKKLHRDMVTICGMGIDRIGWNVGFEVGFGKGEYINSTLSSMTLDTDAHTWEVSPNSNMHVVSSFYYYFNDQLALKSGLGFQSFSSTYSLNGDFRDNVISYDVNNSPYYKYLSIAYDSSLSLNQLTIPIAVNFTSGKPWQLGMYIETGLVFAFNLKKEYHATGSYSMSGYYPDNPEPIRILSIEELGFYTEDDIDRRDTAPVKGLSILAYASAGIRIPLGYYSDLRFGPEIYYGLNNIEKEETYIDIFGKEKDMGSTLLKKYSLKLSYILKL
ncbi:MAG: outer membrane beta-barrel protein [Bacteroidales bacterium]|jgi:hypothetical protein|nr:outer membrane beta-barrel protein [Bacteroidales bacterium]